MSILKSKYKNNIILQFIALIMCLLITLIQKCNLINGFLIFVFQFINVYLVGVSIALILKLNITNDSYLIGYGYSLGLIINIVFYYIYVLFNFSNIYKLFYLIVVVILLVNIIKNRKFLFNLTSGDSSLLVYLCLVYVICFLGVTLVQTTPDLTNGTYYYNDSLFWFGNNISLFKNFPAEDFRLVGNTFNYHYFSSIEIAYESKILGIDINIINLYFSYIIPGILLVYSSYCLLKSVVKQTLLRNIGIVLILFTDCYIISYSSHLYFCSFGFDYGLAFGMMTIAYLINIIKKQNFSLKEILISSIFIAFTTGFKGPVGVVILMAFGIVSLYLLINKRFKDGLVSGCCWLFSFLFVYFMIISGSSSHIGTDGGLSFVGIIGGFDLNKGPIYIHSDLISLGFNDSKLLKLLAIVLFVFLSNIGFSILLLVGIVFCFINIFKYKRIDLINLFLISICLFGILLTLVTHQVGNSQWYFLMSVVPFGVCVGLDAISESINNKKIEILIAIVLVLLSSVDIIRFFKDDVMKYVNNGILVRNNEFENTNLEYYCSKKDYEMCEWLKNNTEEDAYVVIDCFEYDGIKKNEVIGVFSQRYIWNDGEYTGWKEELNRRQELVKDVINQKENSIDKLIDEGVNYFIQTKQQTKDLIMNKEKSILVYENEDYRIYELK